VVVWDMECEGNQIRVVILTINGHGMQLGQIM